ncbi:sugar kinase [Brochothrix campestris]|uniref:PfkB carbohydrate kinase family protein n=1 Tax=Brochothrix campestris FSL F6-1037 TaxID=1265861 RepID=W7DA34_9LIST|nr:sugar kinase [Brochothrix campestris]EUJ42118.1 pfkB carbohydrate kinase family protein [Brochothrix campestris FSL F6-1037]
MNIGAYGEVMMRLTPPEYKLISQTDTVDLSYTGTGVNLLSGLAQFGHDTTLLSALPDNQVGQAAAGALRRLQIDTRALTFAHQHLGLYFLERGYHPRPSQVTYLNRLDSAFCRTTVSKTAIKRWLQPLDAVHICGIALFLTEATRETALAVAEQAATANIPVFFDFNYRPSLNETTDRSVIKATYQRMLPHCSVVFGSERDLTASLGMVGNDVIGQCLRQFELDAFCGTLKTAETMQGFIRTMETTVVSKQSAIPTFDRIGTGDAFCAGVIDGMLAQQSLQQTVEFATAAAVLAHTTFGDSSVLNRAFVNQFMSGNAPAVMR